MDMNDNLILLVNRIESKYGSITKAPKDDPDYQQIRKLYPEKNHNDAVVDDKIINLAQKGYRMQDLTRLTRKSSSYVKQILVDNNVKLKSYFNYTITGPNGTRCYTVNIKHFVYIVYHRMCSTNAMARTYLIARGYKVNKRHTVWHSIRNGNYYLTNYMDMPFQKDGIDSYIYEI